MDDSVIYFMDLSISEINNLRDIEIKAECPDLSWWREGGVKVEAKFEHNFFDVTVEYNKKTYAFAANGKPLYKPIVKNECSYQVEEDAIKICLRKEEPVTWRGRDGSVKIRAE
ncbi:uncharacterized protein [Ptychodera flava]|uniref:uncharacterized protein n=1 Tax=Ptychodera flava TaxID=63121 RepID=UPI00396A3495